MRPGEGGVELAVQAFEEAGEFLEGDKTMRDEPNVVGWCSAGLDRQTARHRSSRIYLVRDYSDCSRMH